MQGRDSLLRHLPFRARVLALRQVQVRLCGKRQRQTSQTREVPLVDTKLDENLDPVVRDFNRLPIDVGCLIIAQHEMTEKSVLKISGGVDAEIDERVEIG
jgi:hypothetical protein